LFPEEDRIRPGDDIVVFGFPLPGALATSGNLTRGSISASAGVRDDVRYLQITAPVQSGNSGGPLLDMQGRVVGVVSYKLNALAVLKVTKDIPQNINFAIKEQILRLFLTAHGIKFSIAANAPEHSAAEIGEMAHAFTGMVLCLR
jgi:S1-C subfamily serine protease